jgi:hypothetical protein
MGEMKNWPANRILGSNPERKRTFWRPRGRGFKCFGEEKGYEFVGLIHVRLGSGRIL